MKSYAIQMAIPLMIVLKPQGEGYGDNRGGLGRRETGEPIEINTSTV